MEGSPPEHPDRALFRQKRNKVIARNIPRFIGFGLVLGGTVALTVVMIRDFQRDPLTPLPYYLLPVIAWGVLLESLLVAGSEFSRSKFIVWREAFSPPFRRSRLLGPRLPAVVQFASVVRVVPGTRVIGEKEHVYSLSIEVIGEERLLVRETDVGTEGVESFLRAFSEWKHNELKEAPSESVAGTPLWVGREWKEEAAIGLGLLVILVTVAILVLLAGNSDDAARLAFLALFVLSSAFAVGWIVSARSRNRRITEMFEGRRKPDW